MIARPTRIPGRDLAPESVHEFSAIYIAERFGLTGARFDLPPYELGRRLQRCSASRSTIGVRSIYEVDRNRDRVPVLGADRPFGWREPPARAALICCGVVGGDAASVPHVRRV